MSVRAAPATFSSRCATLVAPGHAQHHRRALQQPGQGHRGRRAGSSGPNRDLPVPAWPSSSSSRDRPSASTSWKVSMIRRISGSRPVNGASNPSTRCAPPRAASRVGPEQPHRLRLALEWVRPHVGAGDGGRGQRPVVSSVHTVEGSAADCTRAAVCSPRPGDHALTYRAEGHRDRAVTTPTRICNQATPTDSPSASTSSARSNPARTARSASSSCATGTPHTAITASPMKLDRAAVPPHHRAGDREVRTEQLTDLVRVPILRQRREEDEVAEQHRRSAPHPQQHSNRTDSWGCPKFGLWTRRACCGTTTTTRIAPSSAARGRRPAGRRSRPAGRRSRPAGPRSPPAYPGSRPAGSRPSSPRRAP